MRTKIYSTKELKELFLVGTLNNTDKISKVSLHSTLSGIAFGVGKVGNKVLKEIALFEARIFPSFSRGDDLDFTAGEFGVSARYTESGSSTSLRVVAESGTVYEKDTHVFTGSHGIEFEMIDNTITIGDDGFAYISVRSRTLGSNTKVNANTIVKVSSAPTGHRYVINDYMAIGGRDAESDIEYRARIKDAGNRHATATLAMLTQVLMEYDSDVLRLLPMGTSSQGKVMIAVVTRNGKIYSSNELLNLLDASESYFCLNDIRVSGSSYGVEYINIEYQPIDLDFRVQLDESVDADIVRSDIQISLSKMIDYRTWKAGDRFEWDRALLLAQRVSGIKYIPDSYFTPNSDIVIDRYKMPRYRQFIMRNMAGQIISDSGNNLNPIYYQVEPNTNYQSTVL